MTEIYVVRPEDPAEDIAAFVNEEDADAFAATFENVGDVERVTICDRDLAAKLIAERLTYTIDGDDEHGYNIIEDGELMQDERYTTCKAAQARADELNGIND